MSAQPKCRWCGKRRKPSGWEQNTLDGEWARLCGPCATRRLNNPWNALLPMRRVATECDIPAKDIPANVTSAGQRP